MNINFTDVVKAAVGKSGRLSGLRQKMLMFTTLMPLPTLNEYPPKEFVRSGL